MKNTFVWLSIFFSFFFTKICSMTLLWSITIMILFCFCCLSICCLPQYTCTYVYKFTLALSHFHCGHSRHTVPYNYYTYKLGSYTAVRHVVADSHRYCTRSLERSDECVSSGWVCGVFVCVSVQGLYIKSLALLYFALFFFSSLI